MDPFVAEIRIYPFNFAPKGWAFCDGQLLPISQNTALFFLQIEFNGLARVGSDPLEVLRRSIPGYTLINQATPDPSLRDFGSGSGVTGPVDVNSRVQPIRSNTPSTYRTYE